MNRKMASDRNKFTCRTCMKISGDFEQHILTELFEGFEFIDAASIFIWSKFAINLE